ncbi:MULTISPECIES: AfsR/SARP family transcriptional regulator [unclassified Crossiella]|uniref:AfsR/SARP family transcriptional regulator n=1 Tax=unclassified Crossiella TaxID=2620835 RepID=UPI0020000640|nr:MULTISPECIES: AfsR/SARP family transcriptional regulator [unclassified Crossiella]MCK2239253.1 AfsR/SARP family transcriptional regulator [Crossiella sp. S99.2]MCK2251178.1 AfsR/SARP family transcriptional regulator [Crossiella sp. S99.1]
MEVLGAGRLRTPSAPKQRAVLALLILQANEFVPMNRLVEDLWGQRSPARAVAGLQVYIGALRKVLPRNGTETIETCPNGYLLRVPPDRIDLHRYRRLATEGDRALAEGRPERASALLDAALGLWRGPALADLTNIGLLGGYAESLDAHRLSVIERRIDADLSLGRHTAVADELEGLCQRHPLRESLHRQLMVAHWRCGRRAEALATYQRVRHTLVDKLGLEPCEQLRAVQEAVLRGTEPP